MEINLAGIIKFIFRYISPASSSLLFFIFLSLGLLDFLGLTLIVPFANYMLSGDELDLVRRLWNK